MSGPRTSSRVPSGSARTWSTICWTRLALDRVAVVGQCGMADPGEQQAEVVVDLGDGADGRSRVARRALLVDRDRRREPVDLVDVRLLHLAEELAGVRAQALDVAALALGVDRVEREAALAAAGEAGDDDEPVARERDGDVLEVVLAGTANDELILGHVPSSVRDATETEQAFVAGGSARQAVDLEEVRPGAGLGGRRDEHDGGTGRDRPGLAQEPGHEPEPRRGIGRAGRRSRRRRRGRASSRATTSGSGENAKIGTCGRSDERTRAVQPDRV